MEGWHLLTCAPDIWYLKDTTGDGKADVRRVVLTGFGTKSSSEQLRVASPTLGPDGWVYVTSGLTDANVTSPLHPKRKPVVSKRQDGRFHPETFIYESLAGAGQFGQCFDAFGNRFVSSNRNPLMHVVIAPGLLQRNPHYSFTDTIENVIPVAARVYPLSPDTTAASYIPSLISRQHAGTYTSASGIVIRGRSAFICEPAQNLVQRQVLTPAGATYTPRTPRPAAIFLPHPTNGFARSTPLSAPTARCICATWSANTSIILVTCLKPSAVNSLSRQALTTAVFGASSWRPPPLSSPPPPTKLPPVKISPFAKASFLILQ